MNFVDFVINCYNTYHLTCNSSLFASCTHYTSYSLLNIVHVIVCVFRSDQPSLKLLWVFVQNIFFVWEFLGRLVENLILGKLGLKIVFWKSISSHTHAFLFLIFNALKYVFKNQVIFLKRCFSRFSIDLISLDRVDRQSN